MPVKIFHHHTAVCEEILKKFGNDIRLATPLGLGKPNNLLNKIYALAKNDATLKLTIYTALSLSIPHQKSSLAQKFLGPFYEHHFGKNYPELEYEKDALTNKLPRNVILRNFYFQAGNALYAPKLQQEYESINYTHVAKSVFDRNANVLIQLIAKNKNKPSYYSLSCNPDVTLDLVELYRKHKKPVLVIGVVHPHLPFLCGDAEVSEDFFDFIVDESENNYQLFALPRFPIDSVDQMIGFYASQLVSDNGTIQIGIGSLSDALTAALILRHQKNEIYLNLFQKLWQDRKTQVSLENKTFEKGLYGLSEMVSDSYMHLKRADILKRRVKDKKNGENTYLHGGFFLGSKDFYSWLHSLKNEEPCGLQMTRISMVNDLYDPHESTLREQRINARFFNTCMQASLLGGAVSDTLENGNVVSGVGGQYNFVAMAHELENARSILMLRSTRINKGRCISNIQWTLGNLTIPRHLRDIFITEYGIADLRGKTDEEVIIELLNITDSKFQEELLNIAKKNGKIRQDYQIPEWAKNNTLQNLTNFILQDSMKYLFKSFPFGSDFTKVEEKIFIALKKMQALSESSKVKDKLTIIVLCFRGFFIDLQKFTQELKRMDLENPKGLKEKVERLFLLGTLNISNLI